jgi:hypothetical protein
LTGAFLPIAVQSTLLPANEVIEWRSVSQIGQELPSERARRQLHPD